MKDVGLVMALLSAAFSAGGMVYAVRRVETAVDRLSTGFSALSERMARLEGAHGERA